MLIIPTTKEVNSSGATIGYRAVVRVDMTEFHLAGVYNKQVEAMDEAKKLVKGFEDMIRDMLKNKSLFKSNTKAGVRK